MQNREPIQKTFDELLEHIEIARALCASLKYKIQATAESNEDIASQESIMLEAASDLPPLPTLDTIASREDRRKIVLDWMEKASKARRRHKTMTPASQTLMRISEIEQDIIRLAAKLLALRD